MATNHRRPFTVPSDGIPIRALHLLLPLLLLTARCAEAQKNNSSSSSDNNPYFGNANFNPSMAIVIVVLISAFFFLGFFSIYIRQCAGNHSDTIAAARGGAAGGRSRRGGQRGLDPAVLETFPSLVYSEVKGLKIGKGTLECAVCLSEFQDDETLRLLPRCSHVFHPDCIDAWLASHVTCPVCRSNLSVPVPAAAAEIGAHETPGPEESVHRTGEESDPAPEHVTIAVEGEPEGGDRKAEAIDIARIGSVKRGMMGSRSRARAARFPRSHSTGHSLVQPGENLDRFTLRLPENVRKEIVAAGMLQRTRSCAAFPAVGEGSSRRWYRGGEGSSRAGRSIRLGRSDRWPSFFLRSLSARVPGWAAGRKGELEGSVKKGEGEGSTKGKFSAVRVPFDCLGGSAVKSAGYCDDDGESSTAALARV